MKKLAFFILLSLVTLGVSAQSNLKWNVNAGIGMSNWYGDDTDGTDAKFAYKVGIGLEVPFANTNIWSFQTGLNFISKGVKGDGVTDAWDVVDVTINQLYLELPLMVGARIHTASNLHWPLSVINSDHRYNLTFKYIKNGCFSFRKKQPFFLDEAWFMK